MKGFIIFTGAGPLVILTSCESLKSPALLDRLHAKGVSKFFGYELDVDELRHKYGKHFEQVVNDLKQTDDLRVLDFNGHRAFELIPFGRYGAAIYHEPSADEAAS
jgi:hypothetical protein